MAKKTKIFEGKTKILYEGTEQNQAVVMFKDDSAASDGKQKGTIKGKGAANNQVSTFLFKYLEGYHVPTHLVKQLSDNEMLVKKVDIIPVKVVMRNVSTGSFCKKYGFEEGKDLPLPILELFLKNEKLKDPLVNEYHIYAMKLATQQELQVLSKMTVKINAVLKSFFQRRNMTLIDFTIEFGRLGDKVVLADEISFDTCNFKDIKTGEFFNRSEASYKEVLSRVLS
ncbi:phosphoribosylaminoimidazolesuccinocarboxamide synthase [candidate division KSB1 bacterium]